MLSKADLLEYSRMNKALGKAASSNLMLFLQMLKEIDGDINIVEAIEYAAMLIEEYGGAAAQNAASLYTKASGIETKPFVSKVDIDALDSAVRYFVFNGTAASAHALKQMVERQVKNSAHETMMESARKNGQRFARVPVGKTCAFCYMLASRGFEYYSEESAGKGRLHAFHDDCDCEIIAGDDKIEGYDPDKMYQVYSDAYAAAKAEQATEIKRFYEIEREFGVHSPEAIEYAGQVGLEYYKKKGRWQSRYKSHGRRTVSIYVDDEGKAHSDYAVTDYTARKALSILRVMIGSN